MLKNILQAVFLAIILTSCQREVSIIQRPADDPVLLVKIIAVSTPGNDSLVITYDYNNDRRLSKETFYIKYFTSSGSMVLPSWQEYTRDAPGRVTRITNVGRSVMNPTVEVVRYGDVFYINDTSTRVAYINYHNNDHKAVFTYNDAGQVSKTEDFQRFSPGDPLRLVVYHLYLYDAAGNIIERKEFSDNDNNGTFESDVTYRFEYDGKVNPADRRDDAFFESRWSANSPENCIKQYNDYADPVSIDDNVSAQFTYRSDGRPQTAVVSGNSIAQTVRTYFYQ